jgi:hypothetical protein
MDISLELHCEHCGSANYSLPDSEADGQIGCNDCGRDLGTVAELRADLIACVEAQSARALRGGASGDLQPS